MKRKDAELEWAVHELLHDIDPDQKFFLYPKKKCVPDFKQYDPAENDPSKCPMYEGKTVGELRRQAAVDKLAEKPPRYLALESTWGGGDLQTFELNTSQYRQFFKGFAQLFEGLVLLHSHNLVHLDIKAANVVTEERGSGIFDFHFIDFGFLTDIKTFKEDQSMVPLTVDYEIWPYDLRFATDWKYDDINEKSIKEWQAMGKLYTDKFLHQPKVFAYLEYRYKRLYDELKKMDRIDMLKVILKGADMYSMGMLLGLIWYRHVGHTDKYGHPEPVRSINIMGSFKQKQKIWHQGVARDLSSRIFNLIYRLTTPNVLERITAQEAYDEYTSFFPLFDRYFNREELGPSLRVLFPSLPSPQPVPPTPPRLEFISSNLFQNASNLISHKNLVKQMAEPPLNNNILARNIPRNLYVSPEKNKANHIAINMRNKAANYYNQNPSPAPAWLSETYQPPPSPYYGENYKKRKTRKQRR